MYRIKIAGLDYRYIIGSFSVGLITPSRKKHLILMGDIRDPDIAMRPNNGSADCRLTPEEVAAYVLKYKLK